MTYKQLLSENRRTYAFIDFFRKILRSCLRLKPLKYRILKKDSIIHNGSLLYRIQRLSDGAIGGYVECVDNLSQQGRCWISGDAKVYNSAKIEDDAQILNRAEVYEHAHVCQEAEVYDDARVHGYVVLCRRAYIGFTSKVGGFIYLDTNLDGNNNITKSPDFIRLTLFYYPVTITPQNIRVGRVTRSRFEDCWLKMTRQQAKRLGFSKKAYLEIMPLLKALAKSIPRKRM